MMEEHYGIGALLGAGGLLVIAGLVALAGSIWRRIQQNYVENVFVGSFAEEDKFTFQYIWHSGENRWFLTFTNMNDKVVQLDFSPKQFEQIASKLTQNGGDAL